MIEQRLMSIYYLLQKSWKELVVHNFEAIRLIACEKSSFKQLIISNNSKYAMTQALH